MSLSDGSVRNTFTLRVLNKKYGSRTFKVSVEGLEDAKVSLLGLDAKAEPVITTDGDDTGVGRIAVTVPPEALSKLPDTEIVHFTFRVQDTQDGSEMTRAVTFRKPR